MVAALNLSDVAERQGKSINVKLLEKELGIPIVPTVAVKKGRAEELKSIGRCAADNNSDKALLRLQQLC